ncbi:MAG: hypothetical protein ABH807_00400 [Candidatus Shapirobacteria bacterium]
MILADREIIAQIKKGRIKIVPFDPVAVQPSTVDLHLENKVRVFDSWKCGLIVDPGFSGWLTFEISNLSRLPIKIYAGMRIAQICFFQVTSSVLRPYGSKQIGSKYQGQKGPTASRLWMDFQK